MEGLLALVAVLGVTTIGGLVWQRRQGVLRAVAPDGRTNDEDLRELVASLGGTPGDRATLLQFSSAFCAPCRATKRILTEVSEAVQGVTHVEVDAEQHLDVVRRLGIRSTPTTLVLDADGRVTTRASGQPRKVDVIAAVGKAVPS